MIGYPAPRSHMGVCRKGGLSRSAPQALCFIPLETPACYIPRVSQPSCLPRDKNLWVCRENLPLLHTLCNGVCNGWAKGPVTSQSFWHVPTFHAEVWASIVTVKNVCVVGYSPPQIRALANIEYNIGPLSYKSYLTEHKKTKGVPHNMLPTLARSTEHHIEYQYSNFISRPGPPAKTIQRQVPRSRPNPVN